MKRKIVSGLMLTLLLIGMLTFVFNIQQVKGEPKTWTVDDDGPADFHTIQEAINSLDVEDEDTIFVREGTYYENVNVNKSVSLVGEDRNLTIVDGNGTGKVIYIAANNVSITDFTIRKSGTMLYDCGIWVKSINNSISHNTIANNNDGIVILSSYNNIHSNNITDNIWGIGLGSGSKFNSIFGNTVTQNWERGISLYYSSNNTISGNNITINGYGIYLSWSSNNIIFHNNLVDNGKQVLFYVSKNNVWDDGVKGNYWSDYEERYPDAEEIDQSGIWDTPYFIDENNQDNYPLVNTLPPAHDIVTSITAPAYLQLGSASSLNTTVTNRGLSDEATVELLIIINGTAVDSATIPVLQAGSSHTLSYPWTPTVEGTYNVTAYAHPVPGETSVENNQMTKFVTVAVSAPPEAEVQVGVEAGDWIKCDYTVTGWPSGTPYPEWLKVECLSVEGTTATLQVTMHMSDETEQSDTVSVDVVAGGETFDTLYGFVIPTNSTTGDSINMGGDGLTFTVTIDGETTRTYAGASRTVVYASFSQYGTELTYYWDKETGVMVEASTTSGGITRTAKATETNMWEAVLSPFWMQWWFYAIVAVVIVALAGAVYFLKKRKPPTTPPLPSEGTGTIKATDKQVDTHLYPSCFHV